MATKNFKDWHQVLAAIVTVAGGLLLVWWQTNKAGVENREMIRDFTEAVQDSRELRSAVLQPLEGRWSYRLTWDEYFNQRSNAHEADQLFVSEGTADIRWSGDAYHMLLGYENRDDNSGRVYSVGVSVGTLRTSSAGLPNVGDAFIMRYAHRMSIGKVDEGGQVIDYSAVPEKTYEYRIESLELGSDGRVSRIHARFAVPISKGGVLFQREQ